MMNPKFSRTTSRRKTSLREAMALATTGTALAAAAGIANAQNKTDIGALPANYADLNTNFTAIHAWDGYNNNATTPASAMGWGHNVHWYTFALTAPTALDIKLGRNSQNGNPNWVAGLTLWSTSGYTDPSGGAGAGHGFDHTGKSGALSANSYAVTHGLDCSSNGGHNPCQAGDIISGSEWLTDPDVGGVTGFIGYANAGTTGWHNSVGHLVGTGAEVPGNTVTVSNGTAELKTGTLAAGQYLLAVGGSNACADPGPVNFADATAACLEKAIPAGKSNNYDLAIDQVAGGSGKPTLSVNIAGDGTGKVTSAPVGISCSNDSTSGCSGAFDKGTPVTLTATPDSGSQFRGWSGACSNKTGTCPVTMNANQRVTANFGAGSLPPPAGKFALTVTKSGNGKVTSDPVGIDCGSSCSFSFDSGTAVTLTATPDTGYQFSGWSGGGCSGTSTCKVTMNAKTDVTATFAVIAGDGQVALTVTNGGNGKVTSNPAGIDCGSTCSAAFPKETSVTLTAAPNEGFQFGGWGGACSGTDPCTLILSEARNVTATFTAGGGTGPYELTVRTSGSGSVTSSPAGIDCGSSCRASFDSGVSVTLTARPNTGWRFVGWSGPCGASETCTLSLSAAKTITARFAQPPRRDYDGDGRADLFWRSPKTGRNNLWLMTGRTLKASITLPEEDKGWSIAAVADFDGDRNSDVLWHRQASGQNHLWLMQAGTVKSIVALPDQSAGFSAVRAADFDRDGKPDILWHNPASGEVSLTLMDGAALKGTVALPAAPAGYALAEVADFNGDDSPDVWWYDSATGQNGLWLMAATAVQSTETPPVQSAGWKLAGSGLFDDDSKADLLWRKPSTGENQVWLMDGGNRSASADLPKMAGVWYPAAVDDFDGKGHADILWRNRKNGKNRLWVMNGGNVKRKAPVTAFSRGWSTPAH